MKKWLPLLGASVLTATLATTVAISCSKSHEKQEKLNLVDIIKNKKLNKLNVANEQSVKEALIKFNTKLNVSEIKITISKATGIFATETTNYTVTVVLKKIQKFIQEKLLM